MDLRRQGTLLAWFCLVLGGCSVLFDVEPGPNDTPGARGLRVWSGSDSSHTCVSRDNKLLCWGENDYGQLGTGETETIGDDERADTLSPTVFPDDIRDVSMSEDHTCAATTTGELYCWGRAENGALGFANTQDVHEMITEAGPLRTGGSVRAVAAARSMTCIHRATDVVCLGGGDDLLLRALHGAAQGTIFGDDEFPDQVTPAPLAGPVSEIVAGTTHACVVLESGEIQCWGENGSGQLGNGIESAEMLASPQSTSFGLHDLTLGRNFGCGIDIDKNVRCWGQSSNGEHGVGTIESVAFFSETMAVDFDEDVSKVVAGDEHICAMYGSPGKVQCWGEGDYGALGRADTETIGDDEYAVIKAALDLEGVVDIAAGQDHSCAVLETDEVVCWGYNRSETGIPGVLGLGVSCTDLNVTASERCAYSDEPGEPVAGAERFRFDI